MLLSRFWYFILSFALAVAAGILYIAHGFYNRHTENWMNQALGADASAVGWYLKDDARNRAAALLPVALTPDLREALAKSSESEATKEQKEKARKALAKAAESICLEKTEGGAPCPDDLRFTAIWAVDADGRVVAGWHWDHRPDWNLGGHAVVADALAGWIRDDCWVIRENLFRVVARPVERDGGGEPIGAVIGLTAVDGAFAQRVSDRTGAAVSFYVQNVQAQSGAPQGFRTTDFSVVNSDIREASDTPEYKEKGRSMVRKPREDVGIVYTRMPGEAWDLGSGYVVLRNVTLLKTPFSFFDKAEQNDKDKAPTWVLILIGVGLGVVGILFSVIEHTVPLRGFHRESQRFALAKVDTLAPSKFRGLYKKIAADINDGVDKVLSKGGVTRRAADLESVIGPLPAQPQMSAFSVPDTGGAASSEKAVPRRLPPSRSSGAMKAVNEDSVAEAAPRPPPPPPPPGGGGAPPAPKPPPPRPPGAAAADDEAGPVSASAPAASSPEPASAPSPAEELAEWKLVYEEFVKIKKQCGESTEGLTFDRFKGTLERNKAALVSRHQCAAVKFTVYVKDGKAALRASPVK
ncbi:MAG: MXAN_5187 family protein [Polyangiaceae bacterium]